MAEKSRNTMDDVAIALTTLATSNLVLDLTSNMDDVTSGVKKPNARRGKIKMEKMEKENNLLVTFSKRKSGLMKKANELCTMCGVHCAVVLFSPAGKVFSFGHPSVDHVVDRYLTESPNPLFALHKEVGNQVIRPQGPIHGAPHHGDIANTENMISELKDLEASLEAAKKHGKVLEERRAERMNGCWWERPAQELKVHEIQTLRQAMAELKLNVFDMARLRFVPLAPNSSSSPSPLRLGLHCPTFHEAGVSSVFSIGGYLKWNNNNHGPDEAGPSSHAPDILGGSSCSGGRLGGGLRRGSRLF